MPTGFGQATYTPSGSGVLGRPVNCIAGGRLRQKIGGVTIDWTAVTANGADVVVQAEGRTYVKGDKYIRYGTLLCKITGAGQGNTVGKYAPYLSTATDGRQTITRGEAFFLNKSVALSDLASDVVGDVFDAVYDGQVYLDRIASDGTNGVAGNPAKASILTNFPGIVPYED